MIRRGKYKFVCSADDPPLLFDLDTDPNERNNLANEQAYADLASKFLSEVNQKWNNNELSKKIRLSQRQRRLILNSYKHGLKPRWNHEEDANSDVIWYRGEEGYNEWAFAYLPVVSEKNV